ncbi:hypothetical protein TNCV_3143441 [Trichonephila clavipes]|nr:hypothetical protein TNCV_3143441 [Trichonephila clavipes]
MALSSDHSTDMDYQNASLPLYEKSSPEPPTGPTSCAKLEATNKLTGEYIKLYTDTDEQRRELIHKLDELKFQYFAIQSKAEQPIDVVIKGLPRDSKTEDIHNDLLELGAANPDPFHSSPRPITRQLVSHSRMDLFTTLTLPPSSL